MPMREHTNRIVRLFLETDAEERRLSRNAIEPDAMFNAARSKLRRQPNLGQLRIQEWDALIKGAEANGASVYLTIANVYGTNSTAKTPSSVTLVKLSNANSNSLGQYITANEAGVGWGTNWVPTHDWYGGAVYSRALLNKYVPAGAHLFLLPSMDTKKFVKTIGLTRLYNLPPNPPKV